MATDTELTFVRCPSCRSLVPAVSTRCRMCGASLEASGAEEEEDAPAKSGRVRQRTMSKPKSDLNAAVQQLRAEVEEEPAAGDPFSSNGASEAEGASPEAPAESEDDLADPLSAYIDDVQEQVVEEPQSFAPPEEPEKSPFAPPEPEPVPEPIEMTPEPEPVPEPVEMTPEPEPVSVAPEIPVEAVAEPVEVPIEEPIQEEPVIEAVPEEPKEPEKKEKPRLVIESGQKKGRGGLSFGADRSQEKKMDNVEESVEEEVEEQEEEQPAAPTRRKRSRNRKRSRKAREEVQEAAPEFDDDDDDEPKPSPKPREKSPQPREKSPRGGASQKNASRAHITANRSGRLFGWLVSYSHSDGEATELREGKFFVTNSSLKSSDLVIDEPSVSTPHAMVRVSVREGFVVQDLMSERGVFVRRRDDDTYQKIDDTVIIEHGDWLRFGDVEFLVSLVAHVGVK